MQVFKYYNINQFFHCDFRAQVFISPDILLNLDSADKISLENLKASQEVFGIRLYSDDPYCPINLKGSVRFVKSRVWVRIFGFTIYIMILLICMFEGGYRINKRIMQNFEEAKKISIIIPAMACFIDFGLCLNFLNACKFRVILHTYIYSNY